MIFIILLLGAPPIERIDPPEQGYYTKRVWYGRIPIEADITTSDEALVAASERLRLLFDHAPRLRANMEAVHYEVHLIGLRRFASDLPEFRDKKDTRLSKGELFDWHM